MDDALVAYTAAVKRHAELVAQRDAVRERLNHKSIVNRFVRHQTEEEMAELRAELVALEAEIEDAAAMVEELRQGLADDDQ